MSDESISRISWNFDSGKSIDKDEYIDGGKYDEDKGTFSLHANSAKTFEEDGKTAFSVYDGISSKEAEFIVMDLTEAGYLDDGDLSYEDAIRYLDEERNWTGNMNQNDFFKGMLEDKKASLDAAAKELIQIYGLIKETYGEEQEEETAPASNAEKPKIDSAKPGLSEEPDADGNFTVTVQSWGSSPLEGNEQANSCLAKIINNYYPGLTWGSPEHTAIMKQIMDLNPEIYGTDDDHLARGTLDGNRYNSYLHDGETLKLPASLKENTEEFKEYNQTFRDGKSAEEILSTLETIMTECEGFSANGTRYELYDASTAEYDEQSDSYTVEVQEWSTDENGEEVSRRVNVTFSGKGYTSVKFTPIEDGWTRG